MEENGERRSVGSENDDLTNTTIQGLRRFVCAFLELTVVGGLLNDVKDLLRCEPALALLFKKNELSNSLRAASATGHAADPFASSAILYYVDFLYG